MPIVILEGPDGGGKTELAKELLAGPCKGWELTHNEVYPEATGRELFQLYTAQILEGRDTGVLLDRSFDSEGIYGPVMRGVDRLGKHGRKLLNRLCSAVGAIQVICLPEKAVARSNWRAKVGDYVGQELRWSSIYNRYEELLKDPRYVRYDYLWNEGRTRLDLMRRFSTLIRIAEGGDLLPRGYVGSPRARYLFVGEQVNLRRAWVDLPFFDVRGVSVYLAEALEKAGVKEEDAAFVNAYDLEGKLNLIKSHPRVITLGHKAKKAVEHVSFYLPHPSYVLRFDQKRKFMKKLREVVR